MAEPTTEAGRRLLAYELGTGADGSFAEQRMNEMLGGHWEMRDAILAIEQEARAALLAELREDVVVLSESGFQKMLEVARREAIKDERKRLAGLVEKLYKDEQIDWHSRAAVLALLSDGEPGA